ncbi:TPA: restriction endonuclease subunit S [Legionella pneumophila]|nr:restriction endonuclease subunit S [Legionella pneumophila]
MSNLLFVKLKDCCDVVGGSTPKRNNPEYWGDDIPWVTPKDISSLESPFLDDTPEYISEKGYKSCSTYLLPKNAILLTSRAPIGNVAIAGKEMCTNQGFKSLIPHKSVDFLYLYYCIKYLSPKIQALGNGATFKEVSKKVVEDFKIPLPSLQEQKRIAAILDKADAVRRKRQQSIELSEQLLRSVFLDMFGDPISNPKNWKKIKLGVLCNIYRGGSPRPIQQYLGGTIPWIKIGDATKSDDIYLTSTKEKIIESGLSKTRLLQPGSLIFANCGVSLGFARILKIEGCIHDGWLAFDIKDSQLNQLFLLKALNQITKYFQGIAPDGTQPNLNTEIMKNFELIIPPIELQNKFEDIVSRVSGIKQSLVNAFDLANNSFNSLMDKAFKGELSKQLEKELA